MSTIATCGHSITTEEMRKGNIAVKSYDSDCSRCIDYLVVCPKCKKWYQKKRLTTKGKFIERWMKEGR